jgi:transcriptional regulator with XRE-family HTH domain
LLSKQVFSMSDSNSLSLNQQLAQRAKTFCSNLGLTQATLARLLRIDDSHFSRFLSGQANLSGEKTLKLVRLMSLSKRDLELKFGSPEKLTARLMHLQVKGQPMRLSNDGWIAGTGPDQNDGNITDVNQNPARSVPDAAELEFLAGLAGLHQRIIDKINNWQAQKSARPNPNGVTEPGRNVGTNAASSRPRSRGDLL